MFIQQFHCRNTERKNKFSIIIIIHVLTEVKAIPHTRTRTRTRTHTHTPNHISGCAYCQPAWLWFHKGVHPMGSNAITTCIPHLLPWQTKTLHQDGCRLLHSPTPASPVSPLIALCLTRSSLLLCVNLLLHCVSGWLGPVGQECNSGVCGALTLAVLRVVDRHERDAGTWGGDGGTRGVSSGPFFSLNRMVLALLIWMWLKWQQETWRDQIFFSVFLFFLFQEYSFIFSHSLDIYFRPDLDTLHCFNNTCLVSCTCMLSVSSVLMHFTIL